MRFFLSDEKFFIEKLHSLIKNNVMQPENSSRNAMKIHENSGQAKNRRICNSLFSSGLLFSWPICPRSILSSIFNYFNPFVPFKVILNVNLPLILQVC